jgi:branched-chain amino acid transport system permease protein
VQPQSFWVVGGAATIVLALTLFLERTVLGKAVRATAANRLAARLVGIDTAVVMALAFGVSAAIGAVAGVLVTPITLTSYDIGVLLALKGFAAAMLGGMGNPVGAVLGGLIVGLLEAFSAGYLSSNYKDAVAFLTILLVLLVAPQGLLGRAGSERV